MSISRLLGSLLPRPYNTLGGSSSNLSLSHLVRRAHSQVSSSQFQISKRKFVLYESREDWKNFHTPREECLTLSEDTPILLGQTMLHEGEDDSDVPTFFVSPTKRAEYPDMPAYLVPSLMQAEYVDESLNLRSDKQALEILNVDVRSPGCIKSLEHMIGPTQVEAFRCAFKKFEPIVKKRDNDHKEHDHPNRANALNSTGVEFCKTKNYEKAFTYCELALEITKRLSKGKADSCVAKALNNVALILCKMGEYEEAAERYKLVLEMGKKIHGEDYYPVVADFFNNMGCVLYQKGDIKDALEYLKEGLEIQKGEGDRSNAVITLTNLGLVYKKMKKLVRALDNYKKAFEMQERLHKSRDSLAVAESLSRFGITFAQDGNLKEALKHLRRVLEMEKRLQGGKDDLRIVKALKDVSIVLGKEEDFEEALEHKIEALKMLGRLHDKADPTVAAFSNNVGEMLDTMGEQREALKYVREAVIMTLDTCGNDHSSLNLYVDYLVSLLERIDDSKLTVETQEGIVSALGATHPLTETIRERLS